jgi:Copper amine oxidase N-terminal domain
MSQVLLIIFLLLHSGYSSYAINSYKPLDSSEPERFVTTPKDDISILWGMANKSNYPEIIQKGNPDNEPVKLWTPEPFARAGQLELKWSKDIPYAFRQTNTFFNNTPAGWLYITTDIKPGEYDVVLSDSYTNRLINPENGEFETLEPKYSMFSYLSTNPHICCSPVAHINTEDEHHIDIRCYDLKEKTLRWHIKDKRGGEHNCTPYLPVDYRDDFFFYSINGLTSFDSKTGEIDWSHTYLDSENNNLLPEFYIPMDTSKNMILMMCESSVQGNNPFDDSYVCIDYCYLYDTKHKTYSRLIIHGENYKALSQIPNKSLLATIFVDTFDNIDSIFHLYYMYPEADVYVFMLDISKEFFELYPEQKNKGYLVSQVESVGDYYTLSYCNNIDENFTHFEVDYYTHPQPPNYESDKYHFLVNQTKPEKLIEISPALTETGNTYMQVIDDELIIQTIDTINCYDPETQTLKWTIDKSEYEKPEGAFVCAVDWRGVLVMEDLEDKDGNKYSKFRCYNVTPEEPEPTPEPTPEPLPVDEKVILKFTIDVKEYSLDGVISPIDTSPIIKNGRTLIPARYVTEPLGGDVSWNADEKKVVCILGDVTIEMWIDKPMALVNGKEVQIDPHNPDVTPTIIDDRTMVPIRFLAENLGCETKWDAESKEIILIYTP